MNSRISYIEVKPIKSNKTIRKNNHAFYEKIRFQFMILRVLGTLPYIVKNGEITIPWISWLSLYSVLVYSAMLYPGYLSIIQSTETMIAYRNNYEEFISVSSVIGLAFIFYGLPVTHWMELKKIERVISKWKRFQELYEEVTGENFLNLTVRRLGNEGKFKLLCVTSVTGIIASGYAYSNFTINPAGVLIIGYISVLFTVHMIFLFDSMTAVLKVAGDFNQHLRKVIRLGDSVQVARFNNLWVHLAELSYYSGGIFYKINGLLILGMFTNVTVDAFSTFKFYTDGFTGMRLRSTLVGGANLILFSTIARLGGKVSSEVGSNLVTELIEFRTEANDNDLEEELTLFIDCIHTVPYEVSVGGYFDLNRPLIVSVLSTMMTYLVVVLQFSLSQ